MNLSLHAGIDESVVITGLRDSDGELVPQAELAAMTHTLRVAYRGAPVALLEATGEATADGEVSFDTDELTVGVYEYQHLIDNAGDGDVAAEGTLTVSRVIAAPE